MSESNRQGRAYEAQVSSSPSARCKFSGFIPNSAFQIPHSKVGREGIEPLAATSIIKAPGLQPGMRDTTQFGMWSAELGMRNIGLLIFHKPYSELRIPNSPFQQSHPGWTRTTDLLLVRQAPSPLGHGTFLIIPNSEFPIPNSKSTPPRNRTSSNCFEDSHASSTPAGQNVVWF